MKIRPAHTSDAAAICGLVNYYAERGRMLHRSLESVYESLREFHVAEDAGRVVGCVAVDIVWAGLAEVKSLAVARDWARKGIGKALIKAAFADARRIGARKLFALTYERDFFQKLGFRVIKRDSLPEKVWRECVYCPKSEACDEIAMVKQIGARTRAAGAAPRLAKGRAK